MNKMKVKKNDEVIVLRGKDKGKTGKVLRVNPEKRTVIVEKIKFAKEFIRRDQSKNIQGGINEGINVNEPLFIDFHKGEVLHEIIIKPCQVLSGSCFFNDQSFFN